MDFDGHIEILNHMNIEIKILTLKTYVTFRRVSSLSLPITDRDICKLIEFWPSYWISVTRLNFYGYIVIKIEFLDPENLLLDIFHYVLYQLQTEISKIIEFWRPLLILAVILFLLSGQLGLLSKMHSSDLNNHPC